MINLIKHLTLVALVFTFANQAMAVGIDRAKKEISLIIESEPPDLNAMRSTDAVSFQILGHVMEGLTTFDRRGRVAPGVAEKWDIKADKATFYLRKNAKWSDGKPVTAHDFVFAWQTVVNPKTASQYAFIMYPIVNAEAINTGKMKPSTLGVKALDDYTLEIKLAKPTGYFLGLTNFATFYPARKDVFEKYGEKYASKADHSVYNGPFKLAKWVHGASLRLEKNEMYWNKKKIFLNAINIPYITRDQNTKFNLFKDNKVAFIDKLTSDTIKNAVKNKMKVRKFAEGTVFYHGFNHRQGKPTANKNLRKAIQLVFNQKELVDKVIAIPGFKPADTLFPNFLKGVNDKFQKEYPAKPLKQDLVQAKKYLAKAKKELGGKIPPLVLLCDDGENAGKQAQYFQSLMKNQLGLEVKIDKQIFKQRLEKMTNGDYDIVAAGWGPDYDDVMTFADLLASWNENNRGKYNSPTYDKYVRLAQNSADPKTRMDAFGKLQNIITEDVALLPNFERGVVYLNDPKLKGVLRLVVGPDPLFIHARFK
ncbi:MAG: peptide ABC transporter substrate-binding protein [Bdellovibrionales bacterium]